MSFSELKQDLLCVICRHIESPCYPLVCDTLQKKISIERTALDSFCEVADRSFQLQLRRIESAFIVESTLSSSPTTPFNSLRISWVSPPAITLPSFWRSSPDPLQHLKLGSSELSKISPLRILRLSTRLFLRKGTLRACFKISVCPTGALKRGWQEEHGGGPPNGACWHPSFHFCCSFFDARGYIKGYQYGKIKQLPP